MCGLSGVFDSTGRRPVPHELLARMNARIAHRGPDGDGFHFAPGISLAHRRLAIIDLEGGRQPLFNEDGSVVVVFNGEIYNFQALALELEGLGHVFRTRSDTEVIVHAWEQWGPACVDRFRGMFAFALWDSGRETLFLARDRLGKKPLYYAPLADGRVVFASELKAVMAHPDVPRRLDPRAVEDYFALGYVPDPRSIWQDVRKLPPAHTLLWRRGARPVLAAYWDLRMGEDGPRSVEEAGEELIARLREAVSLRLISDVPLGAFLSGGVDSSGVVALMAGLRNHAVETFSIGFADKAFDESDYARAVATRYGTIHHARQVDPDSVEMVDRLAAIYDEPFADSSALPTWRVCGVARERVTVALSGDGGDELLAGYRRYLFHQRTEAVRAMMPRTIRRPLFGALGALYPKLDRAPRWLRAKTTFQELSRDAAEGFFAAVSVMNDPLRRRLFSARMKSDLQGYGASEIISRHMAAAGTDDPVLAAQYVDIKTWLPGDILVKVDRASMAHSLEVRAPLLDHELAEWTARLPSALKLSGNNGKHVLKKALEPLVPNDLLYRPKQGFSMPVSRWFRGPLRGLLTESLTGPTLAETGWFNMGFVRRLLEQHLSGRRDHGPALWSLLMFASFLRAAR